MGKGTPKPPDPYETAAAQGAQNRETALANMETSMVDQSTPFGDLRHDEIGRTANGNPRYRVTQTFGPSGQKLFNLANNQIDRVGSALSQGLDFGTLPQRYSASDVRTQMSGAPDYQGGGAITGHVEASGAPHGLVSDVGNHVTDRGRVEDAMMARLNPQLAESREALGTQLANQGLQPGTEAYNRAMDTANRRENDAQLAVIGAAGQEQQRQFNMSLGNAQLNNQARAQSFAEGQALRGADNEARALRFGETQALAGLQNTNREAELRDRLLQRNMALEDYNALMGAGTQGYGQYVSTPQYQQAAVPLAEMIYGNYQAETSAANTRTQGLYSLLGAGVGAAGFGFGRRGF